MKKKLLAICSFFALVWGFMFSINVNNVSARNVSVHKSRYEVTIPELTYYRYDCDKSTKTCTFDKSDYIKTSISFETVSGQANDPITAVILMKTLLPDSFINYGFKDGYINVFNTSQTFDDLRHHIFTAIAHDDIAYSFEIPNPSKVEMTNVLGFSFGELYHYGLDLNDKDQCRLLSTTLESMMGDPTKYVVNITKKDYQDGYDKGHQDGIGSVDITTDNDKVYQDGYNKGKQDGIGSVDITVDNQQVHDDAYNKGKQDGIDSVDITKDNDKVYQEGYNQGKIDGIASVDTEAIKKESYDKGFSEGQTSVDITTDNEEIYNNAYQEGYNDGNTVGFEEGKNSVNVDEVKKQAYDNGYQNGYNTGFAKGEVSVDITTDNDTAINIFIEKNKYHTDLEFNLNFDKGYDKGKQDGVTHVYETITEDKVVKEYVNKYIKEHEYHTQTEYIDNYDSGYMDGYHNGYDKGLINGKEVVYRDIESDPVIKEYYKDKLVNNTNITFEKEGNKNTYVIKNYVVKQTNNGDFKIVIQEGQDTFRVETVETIIPGETPNKENNSALDNGTIEFFINFGVAILSFVILIGIIWFIRWIVSFSKGNKKYEKSIA